MAGKLTVVDFISTMKNNANGNYNSNGNKSSRNGLIPNSLKFISSCIKTASSGVRSASASVAVSLSGDAQEHKEEVLWASFDRLETGPSSFNRVLLLGYSNGFQVLNVEDASNVRELVSKRGDRVTFLQMQPLPAKSKGHEGFRASHPLLLVVACDEPKGSVNRDGLARDAYDEPQSGSLLISPTTVRFYSLRSHNYVHILRFRSTVYMVRCSPRIVAVGLAAQVYCFDALTLENKFSVLTYPVLQTSGQGMVGINNGYGPMAVGPRWLAYSPSNPLLSNSGRLSPQSLTPPGVSPSTSPGSGSLVARYAMESSKQLAAGLINLGDMGYKTLSKYYQDLMPDGSSSPVSSNSAWKAARTVSHSGETDIPGMVVVKDFISSAVVSQFRAHTSPISALCFDPSGTLLVTASIHGNNINIFRIMRSYSRNGSGNQSHDWSSSHVHLYKLHRGVTSAVIQDICFSHYSQWIAIVSSRGTCHIFVLSPFGGENVLQIQTSQADGPTISPVASSPWWSSPSFMINQHSFSLPPPAAVALSVVSRIKHSSSGWLNTVSNVATSAVGKAFIPSGALAAVFHRSVSCDLQPVLSKEKALEHLLVYTPCGHVVQYKLLSSTGGEQAETTTRIVSGSSTQVQDEELRVRVEAVQGWDVCRRIEWPEREECISEITLVEQETVEMNMDASDYEDNDVGHKELVKHQEQSHLYISNAEVQLNSGRIPIWQNSKISFHTMDALGIDEFNLADISVGGEMQIEQVPVHEVEIRQKDLLPIFDHFHRIPTNRSNRGAGFETSSISSPDPYEAKGKYSEDIIAAKLTSPLPVGDSDDGSLRISSTSIQSGNENSNTKGGSSFVALHMMNQNSVSRDGSSVSFKQPVDHSSTEATNFKNSPSSLTSALPSVGRTITKETQSSNSGGTSESINTSFNCSNLTLNSLGEGLSNDSPDFEQFFQEEYCKALASSESHESAEVVTDIDSNNSPCDREKSEEDGDNDDMLGGVFAFSEEG